MCFLFSRNGFEWWGAERNSETEHAWAFRNDPTILEVVRNRKPWWARGAQEYNVTGPGPATS